MGDLEYTLPDVSLRMTDTPDFYFAEGASDASSIHNPSVELSAAPLNEVAALEPAAAEDAAEQATQLKLTQALAFSSTVWKTKYRIGKCLGSGNNGCVFLCTLTETGVDYAVKLELDDATHVLAKEALKYRDIRGPGVARLFAHEKVELPASASKHAIVMEQLGVSLEETLATDGGTLGLRTVLTLGFDIISAFETLHKAGYIYAYLKLDSFLVTLARDGCRLVDLGRTRTLKVGREPRGWDHAPSARRVVTSVSYQNGNPIGPRDDIQSAGLLLVYLLQGRDALPWVTDPHVSLKSDAWETSGIEQLPTYFQSILRYCLDTMSFVADDFEPDYARLRQLMTDALEQAEELQDTGMWAEDLSRQVWNRKLEAKNRQDEEDANKTTPSPE